MNYSGKPILILLVILMLAASPVFAIDINFDELQKATTNFANDMSKALPFYSTIGLNWSDAYIGSFPHFGVGLSTGLITMDNTSINKMMTSFGFPAIKELPLVGSSHFPLPADSLEARIGIPVIPVDFGIKFGLLPQSWLKSFLDIEIRNMLFGFDIRYVIINSKIFPMRLSAGLGFNWLSGGISYSRENLQFNDSDNAIYINGGKDSKVDIMWGTKSIELKMQASFPYKIVTPYAGVGLSYAWSEAGYKVSGLSIGDAEEQKLKKYGTASKEDFKLIINKRDFNTRVFGGVSINLAYVRLDFTGMYEFIGGNYGATVGLRFQM
jgi:hypothetical protein